jgi:restriction endonuclease S subunit
MSNGISRKIILVDAVAIQNGHPFPQRIESASSGKTAVLQMKDLPDGMALSFGTPDRISAEIKKRYLLRPDDIIFRSRGQTNTAVILKADFGSTVAAAPLMTLRVTSNELLPDYLCWWINQQPAQTHFDRHARGTYGRMISRDALEDLEIHVPPLSVQKQIVELALLGEREQTLLTRLAEAEKRKLHSILIKTASEEK